MLRRCTHLWDLLRASYVRMLVRLGGRHGVPVTVGGYAIRLAPDVVNVTWESIEARSYSVFAAQIAPGAIVFDVGAHFGTYSIIAALRGGSSTQVVAYEPCELTRRYLTQHLRWNGVDRQVIVRSVCCGRTVGETSFFYRPDTPAGISGMVPGEGLLEMMAAVTRIDEDAMQLCLAPDVIKIDVEGAELDVLEGAERTLAVNRPRLLVSVHPKRLAIRGSTPADVLQWLRGHQYRCELIDEDQELHVLARSA